MIWSSRRVAPTAHHVCVCEPTCRQCGKPLSGRQRLFCSRRCKTRDSNIRLQNYAAQQVRGLSRKRALIRLAGGACLRCGYDRHTAALSFHHREPAHKQFGLDLRSLSNRRWKDILREAAKCDLLCANCHAEVHVLDQSDKPPTGGPATRPPCTVSREALSPPAAPSCSASSSRGRRAGSARAGSRASRCAPPRTRGCSRTARG
jgi:hypothetical protein